MVFRASRVAFIPPPYWWLLVTASRAETLVNPQHLLTCLENLRTSTTEDLIMCFQILDCYRGLSKVKKLSWWLALIIPFFVSYRRIILLDKLAHNFDGSLPAKTALSALDEQKMIIKRCRALCGRIWPRCNDALHAYVYLQTTDLDERSCILAFYVPVWLSSSLTT